MYPRWRRGLRESLTPVRNVGCPRASILGSLQAMVRRVSLRRHAASGADASFRTSVSWADRHRESSASGSTPGVPVAVWQSSGPYQRAFPHQRSCVCWEVQSRRQTSGTITSFRRSTSTRCRGPTIGCALIGLEPDPAEEARILSLRLVRDWGRGGAAWGQRAHSAQDALGVTASTE